MLSTMAGMGMDGVQGMNEVRDRCGEGERGDGRAGGAERRLDGGLICT